MSIHTPILVEIIPAVAEKTALLVLIASHCVTLSISLEYVILQSVSIHTTNLVEIGPVVAKKSMMKPWNIQYMTYRQIPVFRVPRSGTCLLVVQLQNQPAHDLPDISKPPYTKSGANQSRNIAIWQTHRQSPRLYIHALDNYMPVPMIQVSLSQGKETLRFNKSPLILEFFLSFLSVSKSLGKH